ncbi:MAG: GatB/YqeY domain-containing protein [Chitinophagaceae bacterium]
MALEQDIMTHLKEAMKAKDEPTLRALRAIKAEIIKAKVEPGANGQITSEGEIKILAKMAKERRDAADLYLKQNREDLAQKEQEEIAVIEKFLPKQLTAEELTAEITKIIAQVGATSPADMGKVMGVASKALAGKADGRAISTAVKELLSK